MPKLSKTEILFRMLPADVQYDIEMQLYDEFNDLQAQASDNYTGLFTSKDLAQLNRLETNRKRALVEEYLRKSKDVAALPTWFVNKWLHGHSLEYHFEPINKLYEQMLTDWQKENGGTENEID